MDLPHRHLPALATAFAVIILCSPAARADTRLAGVFGDHMVLQQGAKLPVWGSASPGEAVAVTIGERTIRTAAGAEDGRWKVEFEPLAAHSQPIDITVAGRNTITIHDVLIGEVWLASGQSNMQYSLKGADNAAEELPKADHPQIRFCIVGTNAAPEPVADRKLEWFVCTPETAKKFSAVGYFFARDLHAALGTPVGVIGSYVSGTPAQAWTPIAALASSPALRQYVDDHESAKKRATTNPSGFNAGVPASLFDGMIAPLTPMPIKGIIWYQGESNTSRAAEYRALFPALITSWRDRWRQPEMPFLFVQLPGFRERSGNAAEPSEWAMLREAQASALKLPKTGMAVTIDLSPPKTILHPKNKIEVGKRLALLARRIAYGQDVISDGPRFVSMKIEGDRVRIDFAHSDGGLHAQPRPVGFALAGADHKWFAADATIAGDAVELHSDQVKSPVAVRYGWAENPEVNLFNGAGLPVAPFRTDDWPE